ncbi:DUF6339 family protein [Vagococcus carniphilus]|uniref:DUF6339 family protein n=1 Tax=Vagococcus carniphilus TaxID=218144 RepID=UPI00289054B1|nr:DUF6339 family protein [Vagococcus carniphilus]MDT2830254.1 DUF6339 family protein [Vagococcus carniphilus]MDT2838686.1 DUF6339 family protein [Vagococcus carniphilus]MDT2853524.1 DUF6339 family protein [Vagococcus carniphilus]
MTDWNNIQYDIGVANNDFRKLEITSTSIMPISINSEMMAIRDKMIEARDYIYEENNFDYSDKLDYKFDLLFGLKLYSILSEEDNFTTRVASNDDIWRYLSIRVIPDIVHARWQFNEEHFYKTPRRIWLKTLWWYIHLSWMGNENDTYKVLQKNSTDTILQLVERPGIGYYTMVYRELMAQYAEHNDTSRVLFRQVLKLNTARLLTISPELYDGGIKAYVTDLFNSIEGN